jgi:HEAT repeat protein
MKFCLALFLAQDADSEEAARFVENIKELCEERSAHHVLDAFALIPLGPRWEEPLAEWIISRMDDPNHPVRMYMGRTFEHFFGVPPTTFSRVGPWENVPREDQAAAMARIRAWWAKWKLISRVELLVHLMRTSRGHWRDQAHDALCGIFDDSFGYPAEPAEAMDRIEEFWAKNKDKIRWDGRHLRWTVDAPDFDPKQVEREIEGLVAKLASEDFKEREGATEKLVSIGRAALDPLARAAKSADPEVAWRADWVRERIGLTGRFATWWTAHRISKMQGDEQARAVAGLAAGSDLSSLLALMSLREVPGADEALKKRVAREPNIAGLVRHAYLQPRLGGVAGYFYAHTSSIPGMPEIPVGELRKLFEDRVPKIRILSAQMAAGRKLAELVPDYERLLKDPDNRCRLAALNALKLMESRGSVPKILEMLEDRDWDIRRWAAKALGKLGGEEVLPALLKQVKGDPHIFAAGAAAEAMGDMATPKAAPFLKEALESRRADARRHKDEYSQNYVTHSIVTAILSIHTASPDDRDVLKLLESIVADDSPRIRSIARDQMSNLLRDPKLPEARKKYYQELIGGPHK